MRLLIVSIYDGGYGFSVYDNGKIYVEECENENNKFYELRNMVRSYLGIDEYIKENFADDYDKIIVCDNGCIEIIK